MKTEVVALSFFVSWPPPPRYLLRNCGEILALLVLSVLGGFDVSKEDALTLLLALVPDAPVPIFGILLLDAEELAPKLLVLERLVLNSDELAPRLPIK